MILLHTLATEERCVTKIWPIRGPDSCDHHDWSKAECVTDPRITIVSSSSNDAWIFCAGTDICFHLFNYSHGIVAESYVGVLNVGMFCEVALQKGWPKFTPSQQYGRVGSTHPSNTWWCQSLMICPSEKWGQLLKWVSNPGPPFGSCSHMPVPKVTYPWPCS